MPSDQRLTFASRRLACVACCLALLTGCASLRVPGTAARSGSAAPLAENEAAAALRRIDEVRDEAQCDQAVKLWQEGRPQEGTQLLNQVLARNSNQPLARRLLADLALERGEVAQAERLLVDLVEQHPDDASARASLAWLYESQGRQLEAQQLFEQLEAGFSPST